jgi:hypothetical protein
MIWTFIAALVVGVLAPLLRGWAWGVPFSLLSIATVLRSFVGSSLTVLLIGTTAFFALRASPIPSEDVSWMAAATGALIGFGLLLSSARRMREVRGLSVLCQRLQEEDARQTASAALGRLLDRIRRGSPQRYAAMVLMATGPLTQAGLWSEARGRLQSLDDDTLPEPQSVLRNQALATCELQFDEVEAAQQAIERIRRPTEESIEVWLVAMEALLLAVRGESESALAHIGAQDTVDNPSLRASHRLVHAHIFAARGDEDAARAELEGLLDEAGAAGLERVLRPRGPASDLAKQVLETKRQSG